MQFHVLNGHLHIWGESDYSNIFPFFFFFTCITTIVIIELWEFFKYFVYYQIGYMIGRFLSQCLGLISSLSRSCFLKHEAFEFYWIQNYNFLITCAFGILSKKYLLSPRSWIFTTSSCKPFKILAVTFRSMINSRQFWCMMWGVGLNLSFYKWISNCHTAICWKEFLPLNCLHATV